MGEGRSASVRDCLFFEAARACKALQWASCFHWGALAHERVVVFALRVAPGRRLDWGGSPLITRGAPTSVAVSEEVVRMAIRIAPGSRSGKSANGSARDPAAVSVAGRAMGRASTHRPFGIGVWRGAFSALAPVFAGLTLLLVWQGIVQASGVSAYLVPAPAAVFHSFLAAIADGLIPHYAMTTLLESLSGFALGAAVALPIGYAVARSRVLAATLEPYLAASQAVPAVALAPLLVLLLGYGLMPVAALCALIVFFPVAVSVTLGLRTLDHDVLDAARLDGAGRWALLRHVEGPLALPSVLAGLRAGLTLSVTGAVVGEFVMGDQGLGGLLIIARGNFDVPLAFATLLALALMAITLYGLARLIEWRILSQQ
jgi:NitT/TauT family transport system permease protein